MGIDRGSGVRVGIDRRRSGVGRGEWGQTGRVGWEGERVGIDRRSGVGKGESGDEQEEWVGGGESGDRQEEEWGGKGREWG